MKEDQSGRLQRVWRDVADGLKLAFCLPAEASVQAGDRAAAQPGWAQRLLGIAGVTQVFALQTFITVSKIPEGDWSVIAPQVERVLNEAFA